MRRPNITDAIKKGLDALPLDIEVWLYGSEARGDARPDSDIDLLVLFNKPKVSFDDECKIYDITSPIEWDAGVAINPMIYSKTPQQHMFDNTLESVTELYPKAQEFISAVKEHVDQWLAENTEKRTS